jgi:phosphoserine phosphatase
MHVKPVLYKEKLLWLRLQRGWSQEEAAFHCGASDKKQYHLWETGKTRLPHASQLAAITAGFSLGSVDEILLRPGAAPDAALQIFYSAHYRQPLPDGRAEQLHDEPPYRLVCFSLDGVLLRGYHFAWEEIWNLLGEDREQRKKGLKLFHTGRLSYEDWCLWCCDIFRSHDLRREQLEALARRFSVIDNLKPGLQALRSAGFRLAIISGSLDIFLQALIPDHAQWFDQVFINRMQFDSNGSIQGIIPTPFDFERKPDAVRYLCSLYGFHTAQSICVGSNFVDKHLIDVAGRTIAFNSTSDEVQELFDWRLDSDNFMDLVDSILALNLPSLAATP